jgi:hypothetical protein
MAICDVNSGHNVVCYMWHILNELVSFMRRSK